MNSILVMNNLKNTAILFTLLFSLSAPLFAEKITVGVVNIREIMQKAPQAQYSSRQIDAKFSPKEKKLAQEKRKIDQLEKELREKEISEKDASGKSRIYLQRSLRKRKRKYQRAREDLNEELHFARSAVLDKVQTEVYNAISAVRENLGIDIILQEYVTASDKVKITEQVLDYLNEKMNEKQNNRNSNSTENNNDSNLTP